MPVASTNRPSRAPEREPLLALLGLPPAKVGGGLLVEPDAARAPVLERRAHVHAPLPLDGSRPYEYLPPDVDGAVLDVVPAETDELAAPEPGRERQPPDRVQPVPGSHLEEPANLVASPRGPLDADLARGWVHGVRDVHDQVSAPDRVVERLVQGDVDVPRGLPRERATFVMLIA